MLEQFKDNFCKTMERGHEEEGQGLRCLDSQDNNDYPAKYSL